MSISVLWNVVYFAWVASEICIAIMTRTRKGGGNVRDRGTMALLWVAIVGSLTVGTSFGNIFGTNLTWPSHTVKWAALAVLICGVLLRWSAVLSLGRAFSSNVAIRATQTVNKTGLYRWMRHPSYTGLLLCIYAAALETRNWIAMLIVVVPTTAALLYRIHVEEIALREAFGAEYVEYCRVTRRLIPGVY